MGGKKQEMELFKRFKRNGLHVQRDAIVCLVNEMELHPELMFEDVIYAIKQGNEQGLSSMVTRKVILMALQALQNVSVDYEGNKVFNAFDIPNLKYNGIKNTYYVDGDEIHEMHAVPSTKLELYSARFCRIEQRIKRNPLFCKPSVANTGQEEVVQLTKIESLIGSVGEKKVVGMIGMDERNVLYMEDRTAKISLNVSDATFMNGYYTVNCIVLVEGEIQDDIFYAKTIGHPPPEARVDSMLAIGDVDPLNQGLSKEQIQQCEALEKQNQSSSFVILSDVHLDDSNVVAGLRLLFEGFKDDPPCTFVLMGNFTSISVGEGSESFDILEIKDFFDALGALILEFEQIAKNSSFVLVPGPTDPCGPGVLPRRGLPNVCLSGLLSVLPDVSISTNPCRIRHYTKEILIFRNENLVNLRRHSIRPVSTLVDDENENSMVDSTEFLVKTIVDQGHLSPLPLNAQPVSWSYDSALHLFPVPHALVLAESCERYQWKYNDMSVFNPGPFYIDQSFVLYYPATDSVEYSSIHNS